MLGERHVPAGWSLVRPLGRADKEQPAFNQSIPEAKYFARKNTALFRKAVFFEITSEALLL